MVVKPHPPKDVFYKATKKLVLVHSDLARPMRQQSWGGARYLSVLVDAFSHKSWMILSKQKSDVVVRLKEWKVSLEIKGGEKMGKFKTDNGGNFCTNSHVDVELPFL